MRQKNNIYCIQNFFADPDAAAILTEATIGFSPSETVQNKIERLNQNEIIPLHFIVLPINGILLTFFNIYISYFSFIFFYK